MKVAKRISITQRLNHLPKQATWLRQAWERNDAEKIKTLTLAISKTLYATYDFARERATE